MCKSKPEAISFLESIKGELGTKRKSLIVRTQNYHIPQSPVLFYPSLSFQTFVHACFFFIVGHTLSRESEFYLFFILLNEDERKCQSSATFSNYHSFFPLSFEPSDLTFSVKLA